jgi:hypothetical protein
MPSIDLLLALLLLPTLEITLSAVQTPPAAGGLRPAACRLRLRLQPRFRWPPFSYRALQLSLCADQLLTSSISVGPCRSAKHANRQHSQPARALDYVGSSIPWLLCG